MPSTPKRALTGCAALVASLALLAGCGSSGGGGSSGTATSAGGTNTFDGSKSEALGYWCMRVTAATGFYADDHILPVGMTVGAGLFINSGNLQFYYDSSGRSGTWSGVTLAPDVATKTYKTTGLVTTVSTSSTGYYGPREGETITEDYVLTPLSTGARLTISGTASGGGTGSVTVDLIPPGLFPYDPDNLDSDWYGYGSKSNEPLYANSSQVCELYDWGPGTELYLYWDAGYDWNEYIYIDMMYREGNTLKGGGWYEGSADDGIATFGTATISLDTSGHPTAVTMNLTEGYGASTVHPVITGGHYVNGDATYLLYDADNIGHYYDLHVDSISGTTLVAAYGAAGSDNLTEFESEGYYDYFSSLNLYAYYGNMTSLATRTSVIYSAAEYENTPATTPGYDQDGLATTRERFTVTVNYDATTGRATSGTMMLQIYDTGNVLQSTENMAFTLSY